MWKSNGPLRAAFLGVIALLSISGCASSGRNTPRAKWAMDDERYAADHAAPYSADRRERLAQKAWDRSDASFQEGKSGVYVGGGSTYGHWPAAGGSLGFFQLPTSWSTLRYGIIGMDNGGIGVGGAEVGLRIHAPTRLTPYVGLSSDLGFSSLHSAIATRNTRYYRKGQTISRATGLFAIVPEAGVSYWVTPSTRLNAGASYFVTDSGPDFLLFGASLEFVMPDTVSSSPTPYPFPDSNEDYPALSDDVRPYFRDADDDLDGVEMAATVRHQPPLARTPPSYELAQPCNTSDDPDAVSNDLPASLVPRSEVFAPPSAASSKSTAPSGEIKGVRTGSELFDFG